MALPSSGQISIDDIQAELGIGEEDPGFTDFGMDQARDGDYGAINQCSTYKPPSTGQISFSDWYGYNHTQACSTTIAWSYSETGGAVAQMKLYVEGVAVETRENTSNGTWTGVLEGDEIYVTIELISACSGNDDAGNVYTTGNRATLVDAGCFVASTGTLTTPTYTVVAGDLSGTITIDTFASCDAACL